MYNILTLWCDLAKAWSSKVFTLVLPVVYRSADGRLREDL